MGKREGAVAADDKLKANLWELNESTRTTQDLSFYWIYVTMCTQPPRRMARNDEEQVVQVTAMSFEKLAERRRSCIFDCLSCSTRIWGLSDREEVFLGEGSRVTCEDAIFSLGLSKFQESSLDRLIYRDVFRTYWHCSRHGASPFAAVGAASRSFAAAFTSSSAVGVV